MTKKEANIPQITNPETGKKRSIVCACAEGKERSVYAVEFLKEHGFIAKLLPGGLENFQEYLIGGNGNNTFDHRMERAFARGVSHIGEVRTDYNSKYNRILRLDNVLWLVFIGGNVELAKFRDIIEKLRDVYSAEVVILESHNRETVEDKIKAVLLGQKPVQKD